MKVRFCPGYSVARSCDRRCATCKHVVIRNLPSGLAPSVRRGQLLPVIGRGAVEELKVIVENERTDIHAG